MTYNDLRRWLQENAGAAGDQLVTVSISVPGAEPVVHTIRRIVRFGELSSQDQSGADLDVDYPLLVGALR